MSSGVARIVPTPPPHAATYRFAFPIDFIETVCSAPALLAMPERLVLYALIVSLQPERVLEIGTRYGGSTLIMTCAMDGIDKGRIDAIDPEPLVSEEALRLIAHRATIHVGYSPTALAAVAAMAGGSFDFAFIDGNHTFDAVMQDLLGALPYLADGAYLLLHDAYSPAVRDAVDAVLEAHSDRLQDCGVLARSGGTAEQMLAPLMETIPNYAQAAHLDERPDGPNGHPEGVSQEKPLSGGFRLLLYREGDFEQVVELSEWTRTLQQVISRQQARTNELETEVRELRDWNQEQRAAIEWHARHSAELERQLMELWTRASH